MVDTKQLREAPPSSVEGWTLRQNAADEIGRLRHGIDWAITCLSHLDDSYCLDEEDIAGMKNLKKLLSVSDIPRCHADNNSCGVGCPCDACDPE